VRIRVRAFGLNRSELFTRQGHSPSVVFPRVLGIECVGTVDDAGGSDLQPGQTVAALMGEMGRAYDGGYAEYTLVPRDHVLPVRTSLPWDVLAALPETWLTARGSVVEAMGVAAGYTLLVRGGTSSVGMAATSLAKHRGVRVLATTRAESKAAALRANGADDVVIDTGGIADDVRQRVPGGVDGVLELVGSTTSTERSTAALQEIVDGVAAGRYGRTCSGRLDSLRSSRRTSSWKTASRRANWSWWSTFDPSRARRFVPNRPIDRRQQTLCEIDGRSPRLTAAVDLERPARLIDLADQGSSLGERGRPPREMERPGIVRRARVRPRHPPIALAGSQIRDEAAVDAHERTNLLPRELQPLAEQGRVDLEHLRRLRARQLHDVAEHISETVWSIEALQHGETAAHFDFIDEQRALGITGTRGL
jgi:NADPH:quinone reductase-like Zn-dependent oxidoreductase